LSVSTKDTVVPGESKSIGILSRGEMPANFLSIQGMTGVSDNVLTYRPSAVPFVIDRKRAGASPRRSHDAMAACGDRSVSMALGAKLPSDRSMSRPPSRREAGSRRRRQPSSLWIDPGTRDTAPRGARRVLIRNPGAQIAHLLPSTGNPVPGLGCRRVLGDLPNDRSGKQFLVHPSAIIAVD